MSIVETGLKRVQADESASRTRRIFGKVVETASSASQAATGRAISIDQDALLAAGFLASKHQEREIASEYRHIKRPLIALAMEGVTTRHGSSGSTVRNRLPNGRLIMVASALADEGKTFTAINLAFSMAMEENLDVVLVDGDVIKRQISKMFGVDAERGLLDGAIDPHIELELERLILPTDVPNLFLLPSGTPSDRATELLASERMVKAVDSLLRRSGRRIFLLDSSPLLLTTEASVLAKLAGQVVVVVRADYTEHHVLMDALSRLPEGCSPSLVLNQSTIKSRGYYYYEYGAAEGTHAG
jgi:protein-tyrosine kinase